MRSTSIPTRSFEMFDQCCLLMKKFFTVAFRSLDGGLLANACWPRFRTIHQPRSRAWLFPSRIAMTEGSAPLSSRSGFVRTRRVRSPLLSSSSGHLQNFLSNDVHISRNDREDNGARVSHVSSHPLILWICVYESEMPCATSASTSDSLLYSNLPYVGNVDLFTEVCTRSLGAHTLNFRLPLAYSSSSYNSVL